MSVLIKGMKMPKSCKECDLLQDYDGDMYCPLNSYLNFGDEENVPDFVMNGCPLAALPEKHGRLIDADAEMKRWGLDNATKYGNETTKQRDFSYSTMLMYEIADILDDATVVIEAEGEG